MVVNVPNLAKTIARWTFPLSHLTPVAKSPFLGSLMSDALFILARFIAGTIVVCCLGVPGLGAADETNTPSRAEKWDDIEPAELLALFGDLKNPDPLNEAAVKLKGHLAAVTISRDVTFTPPFAIRFAQDSDSGMPKDEFAVLCEESLRNNFGQLEKTGFVNKRLTPAMRDEWEKGTFKREFTVHSPSDPETPPPDGRAWDPFQVPQGLSMSADKLLRMTGYASPEHLISKPFPFTPRTCTEVATICFNRGLYQDGKAVCDHILAQFPTDARLLFIRGCCELGLNSKQDCNKTLLALREVWGTDPQLLQVADINGPVAVRFLLAYLSLEQFN